MLALEHESEVVHWRRTKAVKTSKTVTFNGDPAAFYLSFGVNVEDEKPTIQKKTKKAHTEKKGKWDVADFSGLRLTQFPMTIYNKPSLVRYLYLQDNQLTSLPEDLFCMLENLEWLDIRNNKIGRLPQLKSHKRLRSLLAENNRLDCLPRDIWTASNLSNLHLSDNNLDETTISAWEEGVDNLMLYYQQKDRQSSKLVEHKESFDSGMFEAEEKSGEDDLHGDQSSDAQIETVDQDEKSIGDEGLEEEFTDNSKSFYDILDNYPKLQFEDLKIDENTEESSTEKQTEASYSKRKIEKHAKFSEDQEILQFMQNRNLYDDQQVHISNEFDDFDEFLYYYKSFHSPLIEKEFDGFSLDHIKLETKKNDEQKNEQLKKRQIMDTLQVMKDKQAVADWSEKYKNLKKKKQKEFENNDDDLEVNLDPPYATDPDWSLATSIFEDKLYCLANNDVKIDDVVKATAALENEFDKEIEKVIKSTKHPGSLDETRLRVRSARIGRLEQKLEKVKRKARTLSAYKLT